MEVKGQVKSHYSDNVSVIPDRCEGMKLEANVRVCVVHCLWLTLPVNTQSTQT